MITNDFQNRIIQEIEKKLRPTIVSTSIPPQGMGSNVFFVSTDDNREFVVKVGEDNRNEVAVLKVIHESGLDIPVPKVLCDFKIDENTITVLEKIQFSLLEKVADDRKPLFLGSMLDSLTKIHRLKNERVGRLCELAIYDSWKDLLLFKYSGKHPWFDWEEILTRSSLDGNLIRSAIDKLVREIKETQFLEKEYSLLHTDFNQRNLFVDEKTHKIAGIIDWEESMFGDPLYDFARIRLFIRHFNLGENALEDYYNFLQMTDVEKKREEIYFYSLVVDYLAWYSEVSNDFCVGRIKLHQTILEEWLEG